MPDVLETLKILCAEGDGNVMCEAADEIERLRAALKTIGEFCSGDDATLRAIKRLAVVRNIANETLSG